MREYINRQLAMNAFGERVKRSNNSDFAPVPRWNDAVEIVENLPTADVVEVVRCKDCKHRDPEDKKCDLGHDIIWQLPRSDDWYCADGERKDG